MTMNPLHEDHPGLRARVNALIALAKVSPDLSAEDIAILLIGCAHPDWSAEPARSVFGELTFAVSRADAAAGARYENQGSTAGRIAAMDRASTARTMARSLAWSLVLPPEPDGHHETTKETT